MVFPDFQEDQANQACVSFSNTPDTKTSVSNDRNVIESLCLYLNSGGLRGIQGEVGMNGEKGNDGQQGSPGIQVKYNNQLIQRFYDNGILLFVEYYYQTFIEK